MSSSSETSKKVLVRKSKKPINILIVLVVVLIITAIWSAVAITNSDSKTEKIQVTTEKVERSVSGKSIDDDRKDALAAATEIMNLAVKSPTGVDFNERLNTLDTGDLSVIDENLVTKMRFKDTFEDSKDMQLNTYQSLVTLSTLIQKSTGSDALSPSSDIMWKNVYVDTEAGSAFVPLAIYAGPSGGFSFEMIYADGEWKLAPYSLIDSVKLSAKIQGAVDATVK